MALWILNRPSEFANLAELRVAEFLARLPDTWVIRWGFHYQDNAGETREGDFLVLGPRGGLMVIEVKTSVLDFFPSTGRWTTDGFDNPLHQLSAEWKAVIRTVNAHKGGRPELFVTRALALPQLDIAPTIETYHDIPRHLILGESELREFETAWARRFTEAQVRLDARSREIFFETYGREATPKALTHFVDEADRALLRHTEGNYEILDQLAENSQFLIKGGTGSGKTWLAFELARRWAETGENGSNVLFLCYNLALTDFIHEMALKASARGKPARGRIEVLSWEALAKSLLKSAGLAYDVPETDEEKIPFFTHTLPGLMVDIAQEGLCQPAYDALVVDEAQDHDTALGAFPNNWEGPGWWGIYWKLLRKGAASRVAAFYDPAQRPVFRNETGFEDTELRKALRNNPVRVHLQKSVRYSRPILHFLKKLRTPTLAPLVDALRQQGSLPEGPDILLSAVGRAEVQNEVEQIVRNWVSRGLCRPDEILLLSLHGHLEKSTLANCTSLGGCPVREFLRRERGAISRISANRAKGLDARAVILVDFPPFEELERESHQISYFLGASRARQLLAIVHTAGGKTPTQ
jgi:hypothetical protein